MGNVNGSSQVPDFHWEYTDQPHASRRIKILRAHPEIKQLMKGNGDRRDAWIGLVLAIIQVILGYITTRVSMPYKFAVSFTFGSLIAAYHFVLLHEAAHGLVFGPAHPRLNKAYGIFINIFLGIPMFGFFKKHHLVHHKYQGDKDLDIEYPSDFERRVLSNHSILKLFYLQFAPVLQMIRSAICGMKPTTRDEVLNHIVTWGVNGTLAYFGYVYMVGHFVDSFLLAGGVGIIGVWGISVHTVLFNKEDTVSYYGWLNKFYLNLGYHMEHHDFPNVPARYLPEIRRIAPEFYREQHIMDSMYAACFQFLMDPRQGLQSRIKRDPPKSREEKWMEHNPAAA